MAWHCDHPKQPLDQRVAEAAAYYRAKYNQEPTECWVPPADLSAYGSAWAGTIRLHGSRSIQRGELWIGVGQTVTLDG